MGSVAGVLAAETLPGRGMAMVIMGAVMAALLLLVTRMKSVLERPSPGTAGITTAGMIHLLRRVLAWFHRTLDGATYLLLVLILMFHYDLIRANALKALLGVATTLVPIAMFTGHGSIRWPEGLVMSAGSIGGGYIGARLTMHERAKFWVFRILVAVLLLEIVHLGVQYCLDPIFRRCSGTTFEAARFELLMKIASWNVNSIRARLDQVTAWLKLRQPDVLLMQELKGTEFPAEVLRELGYESVAVTQKAYNGVAVLSRHPMETISTTLAGDETDSHARYLEMTIEGIRVVNIYLPNGNPVGTEKFAYKLAWMDRLIKEMSAWREEVCRCWSVAISTLSRRTSIATSLPRGSMTRFSSRNRGRAIGRFSISAISTLSARCIRTRAGQFTFWDYFRQAFEHNRGIRIDHFLLSPSLADQLESCEIDRGPRAQPKPSDHTPIIVELR